MSDSLEYNLQSGETRLILLDCVTRQSEKLGLKKKFCLNTVPKMLVFGVVKNSRKNYDFKTLLVFGKVSLGEKYKQTDGHDFKTLSK